MRAGSRLKADPLRIARFLREVGEIGRDPRGGWRAWLSAPRSALPTRCSSVGL